MKRCALFLIVMFVTTACGPFGTLLYGPERPEALPMTPTFTPSPAPIVTVIPSQSTSQCAYTWATQLMPELDTKLEGQLEAAGVSGASVNATAFGENCIDPATNEVRSFGRMETNIEVSVKVEDLSDQTALNPTLRVILTTLNGLSEEDISRGQSGNRINIIFYTDSEQLALNAYFRDAIDALTASQEGDDLFPAFRVSVVPL